MEELIDVLDRFGNKTGIIKEKSKIKKDGNYHRAISVCFINDNNEVLLQKRSHNKKVYPGLWSMFLKGHVQAGEEIINACIREIKEELGIDVIPSELNYLYGIYDEKITNDYKEKLFFDTFLIKKEVNLDNFMPNDEVMALAYIDINDLSNFVNKNDIRLVPNYLDYEKIFDYLKGEKRLIKEYRR